MKTAYQSMFVVGMAIWLFSPITGRAANLELSFLGNAGYSFVDIAAAADENPSTLDDWSQFAWGLRGQALARLNQNLAAGVEAGYQQLFWYYAIIPFSPSTIYRDLTVTAFNVSGLLTFGSDFNVSIGAGGYIYSDGVAPGFLFSAGYDIPVSESVRIPLLFRTDVILARSLTVPVSLALGVRFELK